MEIYAFSKEINLHDTTHLWIWLSVTSRLNQIKRKYFVVVCIVAMEVYLAI